MIRTKRLVLLGLFTPAWCLAASFTVNTNTDLIDVNPGDGICEATSSAGDCTLRAAIIEANTLAGADDIDLPAGVFLLTIAGSDDDSLMGDLDVGSEMTITGAGMDSTFIDGNSIDRVFQLSSADLELRDLTVRNGLGNSGSANGGGISLSGTPNVVLLQRVHVHNNSADAGGGLYTNTSTTSVVTIKNSLFTENSTVDVGPGNSWGPAVYCKGCTMKIDSSSFNQNHLGAKALTVESGELEILNTTISGNDEGGLRTQNTNAIIKFSTFNNNGGQNLSNFSFDDTHVVQLGNSVLQNDSHFDCQEGDLPTSIGYNVTGDDSCSFTMIGDMQNTDAQLGPFMDNGGATPTHAPGNSSALLNKIPPASCTDTQDEALSEDQRGFVRPFGINCDIGSVERVTDTSFQDGFEGT